MPQPASTTEKSSQLLLLVIFSVSFYLFFGLGPNALLATYSILVLALAIFLLLRPSESPILLLVVILQWVQSSIKIFKANFEGLHINDLSNFDNNIQLSTTLSLTSLLVLTIGLWRGAGSWHPETGNQARVTSTMLPHLSWIRWYLLALIASIILELLAREIPALSQPLIAMANLKWAFYFMLTVAAFNGPLLLRQFWLVASLVEFILGLGGYFSEFKGVFLYAALGIAAVNVRFSVARLLLVSIVGSVAIYIAVLWTAVKPDYREFISEGQTAQVVEVDYFTRMNRLIELFGNVDPNELWKSTELFIHRLSYVDYFAAVIDYVPGTIGHTNGSIWLDAIARPFTPRVLFPEKTVIDDSERTSQYTGMTISGVESGTSISIGYIGESYIDFGMYGMMMPVFLLGYLLGRIYRLLAVEGPMRGLLGSGVASCVVMTFSFLEISITKAFGGLLVTLLVVLIFRYFSDIFLKELISIDSAGNAGLRTQVSSTQKAQ